jgi:hypothetical protein
MQCKWHRERIIRLVAGTLVLTGLALFVATANRWWLLIDAFVGANLLQASLTRWCLLDDVLKKLGVPTPLEEYKASGEK